LKTYNILHKMKVYTSDLLQHEFLSKCLPMTLTDAGDKFFLFTYKYSPKEKKGIDIFSVNLVFYINELIYREISKARGAEHVGFLKQPFDSDSALFFSLLSSYVYDYYSDNDEGMGIDEAYEKLVGLFISFKKQDFEERKQESVREVNNSFDIYDSASVETALNRLCQKKRNIEGALKVTELINGYCLQKNNKKLYGEYLKKIVLAMKSPMGGFIAEENGKMRYMIVGENSNLSDEERKDLSRAKELARKNANLKKIWYETGWYLNMADGKWRKRISDDEFRLIRDDIVETSVNMNGQDVDYVIFNNSENVSNSEIIEAIFSPIKMTKLFKSNKYNGKLPNIVNHPLLFKYYPQLKDLTVLFAQLNTVRIQEQNSYLTKPQYYHSTDTNMILFYGHTHSVSNEDILLHETQHAIQHIENFGTGGNDVIGKIIRNVGGQFIKDYIQNINNIKNCFSNKAMSLDYRSISKKAKEYIDILAKKPPREGDREGYENFMRAYSQLNAIMNMTNSQDDFYMFSGDVGFYLTNMYIGEFEGYLPEKTIDVQNFINYDLKMPEVFKFADYNKDIKKKSEEEYLRLQGEGWKESDLGQLYFNMYKGLYGERESRDVQQTKYIPEELKDYLLPYSSETFEGRYETVLLDEGMPVGLKDVYGAIETYDDTSYIIHLVKTSSIEPYIHELGHLLYDLVQDQNFMSKIVSSFVALKEKTDTLEHYFIKHFLMFLKRSNLDENLSKSIEENEYLNDKRFDNAFHYILFREKKEFKKDEIQEAFDYIKKLRASKV